MRHTVYKLFLLWQHEEEEKWLNEMSAKGLQLISAGFCKYIFDEGESGEYIYRLEMLERFPSNYESIKYIRFIEDTGAEYIGSILKWVYFRKKAADGGFEIYSDIKSKIRHFSRIRTLTAVLLPLNIGNFFNMIHLFIKYNNISDRSVSGFGVALTLLMNVILFTALIKLSSKINTLKKEEFFRE